jgi:hypothetical protein
MRAIRSTHQHPSCACPARKDLVRFLNIPDLFIHALCEYPQVRCGPEDVKGCITQDLAGCRERNQCVPITIYVEMLNKCINQLF